MSINEQKIGPNKTLMIVTDKVKCDWDVSQTPQPQKKWLPHQFLCVSQKSVSKKPSYEIAVFFLKLSYNGHSHKRDKK